VRAVKRLFEFTVALCGRADRDPSGDLPKVASLHSYETSGSQENSSVRRVPAEHLWRVSSTARALRQETPRRASLRSMISSFRVSSYRERIVQRGRKYADSPVKYPLLQ
jgi:hypothetical protein